MRVSVDASALTNSFDGLEELATESKKLRSKFLKDATETIARYAEMHHRFESRSNNPLVQLKSIRSTMIVQK